MLLPKKGRDRYVVINSCHLANSVKEAMRSVLISLTGTLISITETSITEKFEVKGNIWSLYLSSDLVGKETPQAAGNNI